MTTSPLRVLLRSRLTQAMQARDRAAATAVRTAIARIENAEAVPVEGGGGAPVGAMSEHVATAAIGVGAAEAQRRVLDAAQEQGLVRAEIDELIEAAQGYERSAHGERASEARAAAAVLVAVLAEVSAADV